MGSGEWPPEGGGERGWFEGNGGRGAVKDGFLDRLTLEARSGEPSAAPRVTLKEEDARGLYGYKLLRRSLESRTVDLPLGDQRSSLLHTAHTSSRQ
ncbi:hypothetical protein VN12_11540 [Pirellula sp. SH-Sr6A]|nr:hypothetical protein VN12_10180 [Pirellula sp. SH-Sr6A]AMV32749.1 hypothetical protein VN12_11540 [Pirellula sp. SH-Sr6A]